MIEFALGVIVGLLIMALTDGKIRIKKPKNEVQPTEQEIRNAERAAREYMNFIVYDGTEQDEVQ